MKFLKNNLEQARVTFEAGSNKVHVWQWLETIMDEDMKKDFLGKSVDDGMRFEAIAAVGRAIVHMLRGHGLPDPQ